MISDHAMVVTDSDVKPIISKDQEKSIYFPLANLEEIYTACEILSNDIIQTVHDKMKLESIWEKFKTGIQSAIDSYIYIPSKTFRKKNSFSLKMTKRKGNLYRHTKKKKAID